MMKDKNTDKLFREKLLNYEQEPPAYLLENILDGAAGARRKRKIVFWRNAGIAAAVLLAFVAGWQLKYMNSGTIEQSVVVSRNSSPETGTTITAVPEMNTEVKNIQELQVGANETPDKTELTRNLQVAGRINFQEKEITNEKTDSPLIEKTTSLSQVKALQGRIISSEKYANGLHQMKVKSPNTDQLALIDHQIIVQNKQQLVSQNEVRKNGHWMVGAQVSPAYSVNRSSHSSQYASNMLNSSSGSPIELGGGVSVEYKPGKRWSVQSGVYYAGLGQTSGTTSNNNRNDYMYATPGSEYFNTPVKIDAQSSKMIMNSTAGVIEFNGVPAGIVLGTNLEDKTLASAVIVSDARFTQNFEYIEIPLYLRYTILDSRFDVEMLGGFSSNLLVGNETIIETGNGKNLVGKTKDMEALSYSGTVGVGLKYGLSKRIFLNVEPRIKYYLNSLNSNSSVTYKPYTIGVYTGLSYEF